MQAQRGGTEEEEEEVLAVTELHSSAHFWSFGVFLPFRVHGYRTDLGEIGANQVSARACTDRGLPFAPPLSFHFNNATWLIGRGAHANSIIMIYETISSGYHTFSL